MTPLPVFTGTIWQCREHFRRMGMQFGRQGWAGNGFVGLIQETPRGARAVAWRERTEDNGKA